jgi:hypothetical protein
MIKLLLASALLLTMGCVRHEKKQDTVSSALFDTCVVKANQAIDIAERYRKLYDSILLTVGGWRGDFDMHKPGSFDKNTSSGSIIIGVPGEGHFDGVIINDTAELRPVLAGHKYPPGYARFTRVGLPLIGWKEIRFGIDANKMHRLLVVRRDSVIVNKGR